MRFLHHHVKNSTCYIPVREETGFRQQALVEDKNVITAQGYAFVEFGLRIGKRLNAIKDEDAVAAYYRGQRDIRWAEHEKNLSES